MPTKSYYWLTPESPRVDQKLLHQNSMAWQLFASYVTRNQFMRTYVLQRDALRCNMCHKPIDDAPEKITIHHIDYDRECAHPEWCRPEDGHKKVPDCERCHGETSDEFDACASKLRILHRICHWIVHDRPISESKRAPKFDGINFIVCPKGYSTAIKQHLRDEGIPHRSYSYRSALKGTAPFDASFARKELLRYFPERRYRDKDPIIISCEYSQDAITALVNHIHIKRKQRR